jgi:hypothetical protein
MLKFYRFVDACPTDPSERWGRVVAVEDGRPVGVYHWCWSDFAYCPRCGTFAHARCDLPARPEDLDISGGTEVPPGHEYDGCLWRWETGWFATPA